MRRLFHPECAILLGHGRPMHVLLLLQGLLEILDLVPQLQIDLQFPCRYFTYLVYIEVNVILFCLLNVANQFPLLSQYLCIFLYKLHVRCYQLLLLLQDIICLLS